MAVNNGSDVNKVPVAETTWLEGIELVEGRSLPNGVRILSFTLFNGHRYSIPLQGQVLDAVKRVINPVQVFGATDIPDRPE